MFVYVDADGMASLNDLDVFAAFKVTLARPLAKSGRFLAEIGRIDGDHLWVGRAWLDRHGRVDDAEWRAKFEKMVAYAASAGWVDGAGAIRAHIEVLETEPDPDVVPALTDLTIERAGFVFTITIQRPPHNFFDMGLIRSIADALEALDKNDDCRAVVLAANGKSFCAGADLAKNPAIGTNAETANPRDKHLYKEAIRLYRTAKPVVAAVHGSAIGGGLGLACAADFRVTCVEAKFSANFTRLGFHPGFGLAAVLPRLMGAQQASLLLLTGRRIDGAEAVRLGLADELVTQAEVLPAALELAGELAAAAPLALQSARQTLRRDFVGVIEKMTERELVEQEWLRRTEDFAEGVRATAERREPVFKTR